MIKPLATLMSSTGGKVDIVVKQKKNISTTLLMPCMSIISSL